MVCAECRSRKKFEISTKEGANPILQDKDKKTGNLRSYVYSACGLGVIFFVVGDLTCRACLQVRLG